MSWTLTTVAVFALVFLLKVLSRQRNGKPKRLPPGPKGFPIYGSLHLLGKFPHRDLHKLAQKYGPIMHLRLGLVPTVVVSSPQAAELFLKTHDLVFASRPRLQISKHVFYGQKNMTFAQYGSYWRTVQKICTIELLSHVKINSFKSMRKEELDLLIASMKEAACSGGTAVDLSAKVACLTSDMTYRMVFGKKCTDREVDERGFKAAMHEGTALDESPNLADYIPLIASLDLQGLKKRMKSISKVFDDFIEKIIGEHEQSKDETKNKDFVDMGSKETEYRIQKDHIKAIILDVLIAAMDTSAAAVEWTISELIRHPNIMKKVQIELEDVVGKDRTVDESDLNNLKYLDMVVKETFRLHPVVPLLLPHESTENCTVDGFHIPKNSRILINAYAIGRDPNAWDDPEKFFPERFVGNNIDLRSRDFQLIPFGYGRRSCPGMQLGLTVVRLVAAQLLHCFDWELPDGLLPTELDMSENFGLVAFRTNHLLAIPTYRLNK
ncbi:hypothetical protein Dsin_016466 [Dipteronia sinensis]|uniref:Cytochrome P450 n=1 Tax=Dipteronia sinensis TaxID=43782 RepID=A0AAE0E611_9ROSI|nr:hypothetical protein Dsin_016466 [Dipteronia sinensis]